MTLLTLAASAPTAWAQNLSVAEQMVAAGRTAEARDMVSAWWDAFGDTAPAGEIQRALWLRGRLTLDPSLAALDYQRLVTEYRGGPYSDDALLRLALAAEASGDMARAGERFQALARDYPSRPAGIEAARWLEANASVRTAANEGLGTATAPSSSTAETPPPSVTEAESGPGEEALGPAPESTPDTTGAELEPEQGRTADAAAHQRDVDDDPEPEAPEPEQESDAATEPSSEPEQESDAATEPSSEPEQESDGATEPPPEPDTAPQEADAAPTQAVDAIYSVEIGGYLSRQRAERIVERLGEQGHDGRIVHAPGSPLFRVRVGRFTDSDEAETLEARLRTEGFAAGVVSNVNSEEVVAPARSG